MNETASSPDSGDVRPVVRTAGSSRLMPWLLGGAVLLGGALVFNALNSRREAMVASTSLPATEPGGMISAPPPLTLPPAWANPQPGSETERVRRARRPVPTDRTAEPAPRIITRIIERPAPPPAPEPYPEILQRPPVPVVINSPAASSSPAEASQEGKGRVTAGRLLNPSLTVPQGTVIAAVLETALDSTRAGGVRAIVSRDVKSFDGSRVLIPRGSRIYGEYTSELSAGQRRALVQWHRLTRPDAVIIDLDSPAADPLGRAGIHGKVNSNFLARYGGAILQSVLDIGVGIATRSITDDQAVIVAMPGSTQQITGQARQDEVQRTLTVKQGSSVSVFVARDLDFSTVER